MQFLTSELRPLQNCPPHPNIIRLHGICENGAYIKRSGRVDQIIYAIQECAPMGELFDYVKDSPF